MLPGRPRDPHKEQFWRDVLRRWRQSGQCVRAFCRQQHLSEPSFYAWRRLLARRDRPLPRAGTDAPAVTFVPLTVRPEAPPAPASIEVLLSNGRRLRLPLGIAADTVRELVTVLEETPC